MYIHPHEVVYTHAYSDMYMGMLQTSYVYTHQRPPNFPVTKKNTAKVKERVNKVKPEMRGIKDEIILKSKRRIRIGILPDLTRPS